uniref:Zn-dependent exopeptidase M28 n=1 Tax=candidate division WOR-3 bacterium TaxID=2052148 RepID=A0A7V3ZV54_UNCW3
MKKLFILFLFLTLGFSKEYLVAIKILLPIYYDQLATIEEFIPCALLDNTVIGRISEDKKDKLSSFEYYLLSPIHLEKNYAFYFVTYPKEEKDYSIEEKLKKYGEVLYNEGNTFLMKINFDNLKYLRDFELCHLSLERIVLPKSSEISLKEEKDLNIGYPNPIIQQIIDQITPSELAEFIRRLSGEKKCFVLGDSDSIYTRYATTNKNSTAIYYFYENLLSFNLDSVLFDPFSWQSYNDSNVIGVKLGRVYPNYKYFILGAHIDNTSESPNVYAPGADDNGSGTIATLIATKYLSNIPFKYTIKFIAWNSEEFGLYGSQAHAQRARNQGDSIMGVINCDMIACEINNFDSVRVYTGTRQSSRALGDTMFVVNQRYNIGLNIRRSTQMQPNSDHYYYYNNGYNACHVFEDDFCPDYHSTRDRIIQYWFDTLYYCKVVKLVTATLATLAIPDTELSYIAQEKINKEKGKLALKNTFNEIYNISGQKINNNNLRKGVHYLREKHLYFKKVLIR